MIYFQSFDGQAPILIKEEPEDGPNMQKVPSLSDLSDQDSLGKFIIFFYSNWQSPLFINRLIIFNLIKHNN